MVNLKLPPGVPMNDLRLLKHFEHLSLNFYRGQKVQNLAFDTL